MSRADLAPIIQAIVTGLTAIIAAIFAVVVAWIASYVPKAIQAFENRTKIQVSQQDREALTQAAVTGAGIVETMLDQGVLKLAQVTIDNPLVLEQASLALGRVPGAAVAENKTVESMAQSIVGLADTTPKLPPLAVVPVPVPVPLAAGT